jgi:hypothetical protein
VVGVVLVPDVAGDRVASIVLRELAEATAPNLFRGPPQKLAIDRRLADTSHITKPGWIMRWSPTVI